MGNRFVIWCFPTDPRFLQQGNVERYCWKCAVKYHSWDIKPEIFLPRASTPHHPQTMPHYLCIRIKGKLPWNSDTGVPDHLPALSVHSLGKRTWNSFYISPPFKFGIRAFLFVKGSFQQRRVDPSAHRAWILSPLIDYPPIVSRWTKLRLGWTVVQYCLFRMGSSTAQNQS